MRSPRLIKSADTEERNVDIIRNIRDALKVIRFHMGASVGQSVAEAKWGGDRRDRESGIAKGGREAEKERERD